MLFAMGWFRREKGLSSESCVVDEWEHLPTPDIPSDLERELMADDSAHGLARAVWTERDFPAMGWHDATVWAYEVRRGDWESDGWSSQIALDLDYIVRWVERGRGFSFWVAPCTLVFRGVSAFELRGDGSVWGAETLADIHLVRDGWHLEGHDGFDLKVKAEGFRQTFRREPVFVQRQCLTCDERGGIGFGEVPAVL